MAMAMATRNGERKEGKKQGRTQVSAWSAARGRMSKRGTQLMVLGGAVVLRRQSCPSRGLCGRRKAGVSDFPRLVWDEVQGHSNTSLFGTKTGETMYFATRDRKRAQWKGASLPTYTGQGLCPEASNAQAANDDTCTEYLYACGLFGKGCKGRGANVLRTRPRQVSRGEEGAAGVRSMWFSVWCSRMRLVATPTSLFPAGYAPSQPGVITNLPSACFARQLPRNVLTCWLAIWQPDVHPPL